MGNRDNRVVGYLSDAELAQLDEYADEANKSRSELVRMALTEYLDNDRTARIESKVRQLDQKMDTLLTAVETDEHTHTNTQTNTSETVQKVRDIASRIYDNHSSPIPDDKVVRAIEDIAGGDNRTLDKYKGMLKKRGLLYEHPSKSAVWTDQRSEWAGWVEDYVNATPTAETFDYIDEYGLTSDEYEAAVAEASR